MNKNDNPLRKIVASDLYARYSGILSLSDISLFLIDTDGEILLEFIPSPDFCTHVCQERANHVCSDYKKQFASCEEGRFICQHGLENIILPIKVRDEILGYIAGMRVYSQETEYQKFMIDIQSLKNSKCAELEFIAKSIASLKTVEENKISLHEQLGGHIAKNLSLDLSESVSHVDPDIARLSIEK